MSQIDFNAIDTYIADLFSEEDDRSTTTIITNASGNGFDGMSISLVK
ncbi:hypothetical protein KHM83_08720 [Fusibacter paucivorans]|uniref:Uncharacterized protein n=1 Tax=Fusibacter paucivorans TaxID=76009 RepID=A0ABS5PNW3_9FIRM|nr:hypothetical protein [Fusibacter paucivorans]MBS7526758.1 hypothetical protein [Fusibacter paucivorans]